MELGIWLFALILYLLIGGWILTRLARTNPALRIDWDWPGLLLWLVWPAVLGLQYLFGISTPSEKTTQIVALDQLDSRSGIVLTDLKPWGKVEIDGKRFEARASSGFILAGKAVTVVESGPRGLVVTTET